MYKDYHLSSGDRVYWIVVRQVGDDELVWTTERGTFARRYGLVGEMAEVIVDNETKHIPIVWIKRLPILDQLAEV